ncbi:MAG: short-chain fatty acid transporter [Kangiellaceae bacterium]
MTKIISSSADFFSRIMQRWLPDAFLIAVILTGIIFISGLLFEQQSVTQMANHWGSGFWKLLTFSMQMVLILLMGSILAISKPVKSGLSAIAALAKTPNQALVLVTLVSMLAAWLNWGFGLVVGALVAKQVAGRVKDVHFPLLIATAYSGMVIWHSGISGSIPLKIASTGEDALSQLLGRNAIPLSETIFAWQNLVIIGALVATLPLLAILMSPKKESLVRLSKTEEKEIVIDHSTLTPAEKLEHLPIINYLLVLIAGIYLFNYFSSGGTAGLNTINLCLFVLGLALHINPHNYLKAVNQTITTCAGIIIQYPLYAGLMGMMVGSGLAASMSEWFVEISTKETFNLFTFISAGVVNFFVPSGGGQWAVQAPIVIPAANQLGVPLNQAAMAVAWGDAWTNMIQPFWALPLLAIAGLSIRQIMGYCTIILIWSGFVIMGLIYLIY